MTNGLSELASAVLYRLGFYEHAMEVVRHVRDAVYEEYGDDWQDNGTIYSEIAIRREGALAFPFKAFTQVQRDWIERCCRTDSFDVECRSLRSFSCALSVTIPVNPANPSTALISIDVCFEMQAGYGEIEIDERTSTDASDKQIKLALLAYLITQK